MRRLMRLAAVTAAAVASAAWIAHVPYRSEALVRAVPYGARWIIRHRGPAARWETLRGWRPLRLAGRWLGVAEDEWRGLLDDPETARWVRRFGSREVWFFDVPGGGPGAIGGAAWLGGAAGRWRIALQAGWIRGWRRYGDHRGRTLWVWPRRLGAEGPFATIAIEEGLLLVCLSPRPADLIRLLDAYDGTAPRSADPMRLHHRTEPDSVLLQLGRGPGPDLVEIAISEANGTAATGLAVIEGWELAPPGAVPSAEPARPPSLVATALQRAAAALVLPAGAAESWWGADPPAWVTDLRALLSAGLGSPWIVALYDEPLVGRWLGIRVPGLTVSMPLADAETFERRLDSILDRWNAAWQWGLIRGPVPGAPKIRAIESTGGALRRWLGDGGPGYVWADGWITFAASTDTLQMLLAAEVTGRAAEATRAGADGRPRVFLRGASFASALRTAAAAYVLYRTVTDAEGSRNERAALLAAIPSLDVLREVEQFEAALSGGPGRWELKFAARFSADRTAASAAAGEARAR